MMRQTVLFNGKEMMLTWLPVDPRVKVGSVISLEKGGEKWKVVSQYSPQHENTIQRGWGLDLPKSQRLER